MNYLLTCYLVAVLTISDIEEVVIQFHSLETKEDELTFIEEHQDNEDPSILGYVLSITMKQAEYSYNPYNKLKIFNRNKNELDLLIKKNSSNIHLRYVRLLIQENTPRILGYNDSIEKDKLFIGKLLETIDETDYLDIFIKANTSL